MPTYEYECTACGHTFECFQSIKDPPRKQCPKCRHKVRRLVGAGAGLIFKGSGFYSTDYRSKNYQDGKKRESSEPSPAAKTDSKPSTAVKPASKPADAK